MEILFVTSVSVIALDPADSRRLYVDALGLPLERFGGEYFASERIGGSKHFGVWPLAEAATACFGSPHWPAGRVVPPVSLEFELAHADAVAAGAAELEAAGFALLPGAHTEPRGQVVARVQSADGAIIGLSYAPSLH